MPRLNAPTIPEGTDKVVPETNVSKKSAEFAPKLLQPLASLPPTAPPTEPQAAAAPEENVAPHNYDHVFIIKKLDRFVENSFDGEVAFLSIPQEVNEQASTLVQDLLEADVEINALTAKWNDIDEHMKSTTSKFVINKLEASYQELNKTISMLRSRRMCFHSDLDHMVWNICNDHQAETTKYTELVQGHINDAAQQKKKKRKRAVTKNLAPPPPSENQTEPFIEQQQ